MRGGKRYASGDFGYCLAMVLDLFWKNTVTKMDRFCGALEEIVQGKQA